MSLSILRGCGSGCFGKDDERDTATEDRECGMVMSESFLDSTRRMVESWLGYGWSGCWMVGEMVV